MFAWRPPARARRGAERRARPGRRRDATALDAFDARRASRARRCCARSTTPGVLAAGRRPRRARGSPRWPARTTRRSLLAAALAVRGAAARARLRRPRDDPRHRDGRRRRAGRPDRAAVARAGRLGRAASRRAPLGRRGPAPLRLVGIALYLDRYWREERQVAADLLRAAGAPRRRRSTTRVLADGLARLFAGERRPRSGSPPRPRCGAASRSSPAARAPARRRPSRGSSRCWPSRRGRGRPPLVALAAPTGKAAARLEEAVHEEAARLDVARRRPRRGCSALDASTLHRLLGWRPGTPQPLPPRPRQPAAARRRDRRRDLDGLAVADGAARRGGAAGRAADPRRRPRPARPRSRPARCSATSSAPADARAAIVVLDARPPLRRRRSRELADGDPRAATATRVAALRAGAERDVDRRRRRATPAALDAASATRAVGAARAVDRGRARRRRRAARSTRSARFRVLCAHRRGAARRRARGRRGSRAGSPAIDGFGAERAGTSGARCS